MLWLAKHPRSNHLYRKIEKERPHLVPSMFTLLFWCGVSWFRWSSGKGGPTSTTVGFSVGPSPRRRRRRKKEHDVPLVVFVLRDPHESRRHGRVSEQPSPLFQKPVAAPHSIRGSGLAGGVGQLVLALRPCHGGKLCRWRGSPVVRAMARTRVEHRRRPIVPLSSRTHRVGRTHVKRGLVVDGTTIFQSPRPTLRSRSNQSRRATKPIGRGRWHQVVPDV